MKIHRRFVVLAAVAAVALPCTRAPLAAQQAPARAVRARVDSLLARMTLEEKVGQMTQIDLPNFLAAGAQSPDSVRLDLQKLRTGIVQRHIGSILNSPGSAPTVKGWNGLIRQIQDVATRETRLRIPVLYGVDAVHGVNYTVDATIFPQNIGMAATFDSALARREGEIVAAELTAAGTPWNFAPVLDVGRQPLWPRFYETLGEEPFIGRRLGRAQVEGMQASGHVAVSLKHYLGYGGPTSGHDRTPALISRRMVRELYLPPFAEAVRAGAKTVMVNSSEIDGEALHASRYWLTDVLRGELGFQGVIVTDYQDIIYLHTRHHVAATLKDAVRIAVQAGVDMSMTPNDYQFADDLLQLVREGTIPVSRIDQSVRRILTLKAELGLFDRPYPDPAARAGFATAGAREAAAQAARESITLLKNDSVLPLRPGARVLVTGPAANSLTALNGGWTYVWQGNDASRFPAGVPTILDAIRKQSADVRYVPDSSFTELGDMAAVTRATAGADAAIVVLGEDAYAEGVGNIDDLTLPESQLMLAEAVQATGIPTILVLVEGRPRLIDRVAERARGIVLAYWPGMQGGTAVADVLFGRVNPSGRLPFTYPRRPNALTTYDHRFTEELSTGDGGGATGGFDPQFQLGEGLSYTTFAYSDLKLGADTVGLADGVSAQVTVRNTGARAGDDVVLLFTHQQYGSLTPAVRRLRGFQRVALAPGESRTLRFALAPEDLAFVGQDGHPVLEPGAFDIMVGSLKATFQVVNRGRSAAVRAAPQR